LKPANKQFEQKFNQMNNAITSLQNNFNDPDAINTINKILDDFDKNYSTTSFYKHCKPTLDDIRNFLTQMQEHAKFANTFTKLKDSLTNLNNDWDNPAAKKQDLARANKIFQQLQTYDKTDPFYSNAQVPSAMDSISSFFANPSKNSLVGLVFVKMGNDSDMINSTIQNDNMQLQGGHIDNDIQWMASQK